LLAYSTTSKAYRVWNLAVVLLRRFMMWTLMKPMVPKMKMRI
jgi:hypothetical protein